MNNDKKELDKLKEIAGIYDYGNGEFIENHGELKGDYDITLEAPNNATIGVKFNKKDSFTGTIQTICYFMTNFSADDTFDELWNPEFGAHNHFKPSQFMRMLKEDEEFFLNEGRCLNEKYNI